MGESLQQERKSSWASRLAAPGSPRMVPRSLHFTSVTPFWTVLGSCEPSTRFAVNSASYQAQMISIKILSKMDNCAKFLRAVGALCEAF